MTLPAWVRGAARRLGVRRRHGAVHYPRVNFGSGLGDGAWLLFGLVEAMQPDVCVEIGSARGQSACYIGMALKHAGRGHLFAIDPHEATTWNDAGAANTYDEMRRNLRAIEVEPYVTIVRKFSGDAARDWTKRIDLLFIDGDHSYEGVKRDWDLFSPHVGEFGTVIFHDTMWGRRPDPAWSRSDMGVPRFVDELRQAGYPVITLAEHFGISIVQPRIGGVALSGA
jgi:predicted O-methyltransferase YrrM